MTKNLKSELSRAFDPTLLALDLGIVCDPWQKQVLLSTAPRVLLNNSRQSGKSTITAVLGLHTALYQEKSLTLLLSPSLRQSGELFKKLMSFYRHLDSPVPAEQQTALTLTLSNGSRVNSLPSKEGTIRGFSGVSLLIVDEASRVPDDLYRSVRPMLATSGGRLICLSTPFGKRGFFFEEFTGRNSWERIQISADQCPRISQEFLAEERSALGDRWFAQEYGCSFEDTVDAVFAGDDIDAALDPTLQPLFG